MRRILYICALGMGISVCLTGNLTYDEYYSMSIAKLPVGEIIRITGRDVHPPLYYLCLHFFMKLFPVGFSQAGKIFSVLFWWGFLGILEKRFLRKMEETEGLFFLFLCIFLPCMLVNSGNVRMYSFAQFWAMVTVSLMAWIWEGRSKLPVWIGLIVAGLCGMYTHTFTMLGVFWTFAVTFFYLLWNKRFQDLGKLLGCGAVVAVGYVPWISTLLNQAANHGDVVDAYTKDTFWVIVSEWFSSWHTPSMKGNVPGVILFAGLLLVAVVRSVKEKKKEAFFRSLPFVLVVLTGVLVSIFYLPCFYGRYGFPFLWCLFFPVVYGFGKLPKVCKAGCVGVVLLMFVITARWEYRMEYDNGLHIWHEFAQEHIHEGDMLIYSTLHASILESEADPYHYGPNPEFSPFVDQTAYVKKAQWEQYEGHQIWWVAVGDMTPAYFGYEGEHQFSMFYQGIPFSIWKCE